MQAILQIFGSRNAGGFCLLPAQIGSFLFGILNDFERSVSAVQLS